MVSPSIRAVSYTHLIFPLHSPFLDHIELVTEGSVRRSRLYYLRDLKGKAARIKPKKRY